MLRVRLSTLAGDFLDADSFSKALSREVEEKVAALQEAQVRLLVGKPVPGFSGEKADALMSIDFDNAGVAFEDDGDGRTAMLLANVITD